MKVVLVNHGTASEWGGGDSIQIQETGRVLAARGWEVSIQNSDRPDIRGADVVHIFNCRVFNSFKQQISVCQQSGIPAIVSPIWISIGRALWGSRATTMLLQEAINNGENSISEKLKLLSNRELKVHLPEGTIDSMGNGSMNLEWIKEAGKLLQTCNGILPNSWLELKAIQSDLNWRGKNYGVAHYGVNPQKFMDADPGIFRKYTGIKGDFIIQAGRVEPGKNQAMLCWALKDCDIPIVLVGKDEHWPSYAKLCKQIAGDKLTLIKHMPQEVLASGYAAARVHCLPSWMDTCGLVSLEAGINGTPIVGSTFGHELEYLKDDAWLADPGNPESIKEAVLDAWAAGRNNKRSQNLKKRILSDFNWEKTADQTEKIYIKAIENA
ncbi:Glycosyltransferase-like [Synechococcus sp. CC9902]|uniref:glycosyltransferase family 4 protein n=1 Tax=Synechococcus sp. (strain CC9902) TaxID=316279 RepID=UPI00005D3D10|nr:glycosyltransferase family 4 protein [Synechococcus sp. CC9902]ABB25094.1 Glycosyltransferase-like [Synechococcus sp. CC9902]